MEIKFQNKLADLRERYEYIVYETQEGKQLGRQVSAFRQRIMLFLFTFMLTLVWGILGYFNISLKAGTAIVLGSGFAFLFLVYGAFFILSLLGLKLHHLAAKDALQQYEKKLTPTEIRCFQLEKTLQIDAEGIALHDVESQHHWRWKRVESINSMRNFILVDFGCGSVIQIPKRDFVSEQAALEFETMLKTMKAENVDQVQAIGH